MTNEVVIASVLTTSCYLFWKVVWPSFTFSPDCVPLLLQKVIRFYLDLNFQAVISSTYHQVAVYSGC